MSVKTNVMQAFGFIQLAIRADQPIMLVGAHGIGKSQTFENAAKRLRIGFRVLDLSLLEPVDLVGIPRIEGGQTVYSPPSILPTGGRGILLLEELNRAPQQTRAPALNLLTRRQLHEYVLPSGWLPCACINPAEGQYEVDELDPALMSRFMVLHMEANHKAWLRWAIKSHVHPAIVDYVKASPDIFENTDVDPRSLDYASSIVKAHEANKKRSTDPAFLLPPLVGLLGDSVGTAMAQYFCESPELPNPKDILVRYATVRPAILRMLEQGRLETARSVLLRLQRILQKQSNWDKVRKGNPKRLENLHRFLADIPADMRDEFREWLDDRGYSFGESDRNDDIELYIELGI